MRHCDDGLLRRLADEADHGFTLAAPDERHLAGCPVCQARLAQVRAESHAMQRLLAASPPPVNPTAGLARLRARLAADPPGLTWQERILGMSQRSRLVKPLTALAALALLVAALFVTPLGSYAQGFLTLFTPKQFVAVPVTQDQMRGLPDLSDFGTMAPSTASAPRPQAVGSLEEAAQAAGIALKTPASLPANAQGKTQYAVMPGQTGSFTFSAAKAQAAAARRGQTLPAMPAKIDGSTLTVTTYPAAVIGYGETQPGAAGPRGSLPAGAAQTAPGQTPPAVMIVQAKAPIVTSTGVTTDELLNYLLAQPGIAPSLAQSIRGIADPSSTLPIPIPVEKMASRQVQVQGTNGLLVGDQTGLGAGVVWQKDGIVYAVGGMLKDSDALAIANSLR